MRLYQFLPFISSPLPPPCFSIHDRTVSNSRSMPSLVLELSNITQPLDGVAQLSWILNLNYCEHLRGHIIDVRIKCADSSFTWMHFAFNVHSGLYRSFLLLLIVLRNVPLSVQAPSSSVLPLPPLLQTPPPLHFPLSSSKFNPDSSLKSGFSVLNQTYGMLL